MTVVSVDIRRYGIQPSYLSDVAGEFGGQELVATTDSEYLTEFQFENAAHAKGFRDALDSSFLLRDQAA